MNDTDFPDSLTGDNETPQIVTDDSPLPDMLWAALRQIAPPVVTFALAKGWLSNDLSILLGVIGGVLWPIVAGQLKTRHRATQLVNLGKDRRVPAAIITTKSAS